MFTCGEISCIEVQFRVFPSSCETTSQSLRLSYTCKLALQTCSKVLYEEASMTCFKATAFWCCFSYALHAYLQLRWHVEGVDLVAMPHVIQQWRYVTGIVWAAPKDVDRRGIQVICQAWDQCTAQGTAPLLPVIKRSTHCSRWSCNTEHCVGAMPGYCRLAWGRHAFM